jgi:Short C-terminal domain
VKLFPSNASPSSRRGRRDYDVQMESEPMMTFKSHVDGKNADVAIYVDRIEWGQMGGVSLTRLAAGAATMGVSLLKTGVRKGGASEMIPVKSMSSVTTAKDGLRFHKVVVICSGNTVEFRINKAEGEAAKALLTQLIPGTHSAQQVQQAPIPPVAATLGHVVSSPPLAIPTPLLSVIDQIKELAQLRDSGILTEEEFVSQKSKLLG